MLVVVVKAASEESEDEDEEEEKEKGFKEEEKAFGSCSKANPFALATALETPPALEIADVISGDAARSPATAKGSTERAENLFFPLLLFLLLCLSAKTSAAAVAAAAGARNLSRAAKPAQPNAKALRTSWSTQQELERRPPTRAMTSEGGG